jgi:iron complex transport system substrate-binding protein
VIGVSHECDFPAEANRRPRVTRCPVHEAGLTSREVDDWVRRALRENGTIYSIDEPLLRDLMPDVIFTQKLCDVCAVGYGTVARLAQTLPGPPQVVNFEPSSLSDIFGDIQRVAKVCDVPIARTKSSANYAIGSKRCAAAQIALPIGRVVF